MARYALAHWRGELSLATSALLNGLLPFIVLLLLLIPLGQRIESPYVLHPAMVLILTWMVWALVGTARCAFRIMRAGPTSLTAVGFAVFALAVVIFVAFVVFADLWRLFVPSYVFAQSEVSGEEASRPLRIAEGSAPRATVAMYLEAMAERDDNPSLAFYSRATQDMLRSWSVTDAQMANVARTYRRCTVEREPISGSYAVVRYPIEARQCAPFFLQREGGEWRLDLTMLQKAVRFGRNNVWRLEPTADHPYSFAFDDWQFDANGFPIRER